MALKEKMFLWVSLLYILYTVFPIFPDITGIPVWIVNLLTFVALFVLYPRAYANPVIYWFLAYAIVLAIYVLFGKPLTIGIGTVHDSKKIIIEYAFFLPSLSVFSILYYLKDKRLYRTISLVGLLFVAISFLYLIPLIFSDNNILRRTYSLTIATNSKPFGMPNYTLMHAYVLVVPAILYGIKKLEDWGKYMMLIVFLMFAYIILNSYITTSLIIMLGVIVFNLLFDTQKKARSFFVIFLMFIIICFLHLFGVFVQMFDFLIEYFYGTAVQGKIEGFEYIYMHGNVGNSGGDITGRMSYHDLSWKAFAENIFFGGSSSVGGHSSLIDRLGGMGLLAFIPFFMIIVSQIKMFQKVFRNSEQRIYYYLGVAAAFIMLYQKGLFGQEGWLFLIILMPGLIITFQDSRESQMQQRP